MLYLYHGADPTISRRLLTDFISGHEQKNPLRLAVTDVTLSALKEVLLPQPMFGQKTLLIIEGDPVKIKEEMLSFLATPSPHADVVFWFSDKLGKTDQLFKLIAQRGQVFEGNGAAVPEEIFSFLDKVSQRDKVAMQQELLLLTQQGSEAYYLLSMIIWQYRNLLGAHFDTKYMRTIHPYVLKKAKTAQKKFTRQELLRHYQFLLECDRLIKHGTLSRDDAIFSLLLKL